MKTYPTLQTAAVAALAEAIPLAARDRWEYGGYLIEVSHGEYTYSTPITSKDAHHVELTPQLNELLGRPEGILTTEVDLVRKAGIVANYHVHLSGLPNGAPTVFSGADMGMMVTLKHATCYIGVDDTGEVYEGRADGEGMHIVFPDYPPDVRSENDKRLFELFVIMRYPEIIAAQGPSIGNIHDLEARSQRHVA
jgi:hypothetical protein